jgi:glucose/arabinose dehydrogenase
LPIELARRVGAAALCAGLLALPLPAPAAQEGPPDSVWSAHGTLAVETFAGGLSYPWSIAFLPDGSALVTEKHPGRLRRVAPDGTVSPPIAGVPDLVPEGNGGLLGLALDPDYATNGRIYMAFTEAGGGEATGLAVARARLAGDRLEDVRTIFRQRPKVVDVRNFGGRLLFAPDGTLLILAGNRFADDKVQDPAYTVGVIARVMPDGSAPPDNPFVAVEGADPVVWSRGHRNPGAAAFHPETGALYVAEFGPAGGDELNMPYAGSNHGWPAVSWGGRYGGEDIPDPPTRPEFDREIYFWNPTFGPQGMTFYEGDLFAQWKGNMLLGCLTRKCLGRLTVEGARVLSEERIPLGVRIRDVAEGPDGAVYLLTDRRDGAILRLAPAPPAQTD